MNVIRFWNDVALQANRRDHTLGGEQAGPTLSSRALALVHLAMQDAYLGVLGAAAPYPVYLHALPARSPAATSPQVAAGAAADWMLRTLFPKQTTDLDLAQAASCSMWPWDAASGGYGQEVARALWATRKADIPAEVAYAPAAPCDHRPDPENPTQGYHGTAYGGTRPFATTRPHRAGPPPACPASPDFQAALDEVRRLGGASDQPGTQRTPDETAAAIFWAYDGASGIGTPPRLYNQVLRLLAEQHVLTEVQELRLYALANAAMADAGVACWAAKYEHRLARPVVGIRQQPTQKGGDPFWRPLGSPRTNTDGKPFTPPFPAYPSGHATFGAAAFQVARRFLWDLSSPAPTSSSKGRGPKRPAAASRGPDTFAFEFVSDELDGIAAWPAGPGGRSVRTRSPRRFASLWDAIRENALSRLWMGVHWRFDAFADDAYTINVGGVPLGLGIADDIFDSGLRQP